MKNQGQREESVNIHTYSVGCSSALTHVCISSLTVVGGDGGSAVSWCEGHVSTPALCCVSVHVLGKKTKYKINVSRLASFPVHSRLMVNHYYSRNE